LRFFPLLAKEGVRGRFLLTQHFNRRTERAKRTALRAHATAAEQRLWQHLRGEQFGVKFRRQYSVDAYVLDFYAPRSKLAVEVDSHFRPAATVYDEERTRHLKRFGIEVVRFRNAEVAENIEAVLAAIGEALKRWPTTSPSPPPSKGGGNSFGPGNTSP
jgi:very-short-patch-repair endonuclease